MANLWCVPENDLGTGPFCLLPQLYDVVILGKEVADVSGHDLEQADVAYLMKMGASTQ